MGQLEDILKHQNMVRNNIMKSFGAETSEDSLEKSFEDEVNPFEMEAYKSELTKAELDEFEKAKHQDGDMHPNGKWVWRQSANGGKGDWRVAKSSRGGGSSKTTSSSSSSDSKTTKVPAIKHQVDNFMYTIQTVNSNFTDESKVTVVKTDKGNWDTYYDGKRVGIVNSSVLSEKVAKEKGWLKEDDSKSQNKQDNKTNNTAFNKIANKNDKTIDWDDITVTKLDDGGLYTSLDTKMKVITIGSKKYRVDLQNESLLHMNSGVKVKSNAPEMARFKKLLDANKKDDKEIPNAAQASISNIIRKTFGKNLSSLKFNGKKVIINVDGKAYGSGYSSYVKSYYKDGKWTGSETANSSDKSSIDDVEKKLGTLIKYVNQIELIENYD